VAVICYEFASNALMTNRLENVLMFSLSLHLRISGPVNPNRQKEISMKYENPILIEVLEYEKPVLVNLEEVVAGCGFCNTGGSSIN
jgi:hypothetical protein